MDKLKYHPRQAQARELAEASVSDGDETRLAEAARAFLHSCGYEPGFGQALERVARVEQALDAVRADLRATGLTGEIRLVRADWDWSHRNLVVETWAGDRGWSTGIFPGEAADDLLVTCFFCSGVAGCLAE